MVFPSQKPSTDRAIVLGSPLTRYAGLLWELRDKPGFQASSRILPKMILAVPHWDNREVVKEAYGLRAPLLYLPPTTN